MKTATVRWVLCFVTILLCAVATWISLHLVSLHLAPGDLQADQGLLAGMCTSAEDENVSCAKVVKSKYGVVGVPWWFDELKQVQGPDGQMQTRVVTRRGIISIPVAQFGLCYYLFMGIWFLSTGVPSIASRRWHLLPLILSALAVLASIWFIYVLATRLDAFCRLCAILHAINFMMCGIMVLLWPRGTAPKREPADSNLRPSIVRPAHAVVTVACALAVCAFVFSQAYAVQAVRQTSAATKELQDARTKIYEDMRRRGLGIAYAGYSGIRRIDVPAREDAAVLGDRDAPHEIVIFSDLQCPGCRAFETLFKKRIMPLFGGQARLTYRHFPLSAKCNPRYDLKHDHACEAAYAAEAARIVGGDQAFWKMHDIIQSNQAAMRGPAFNASAFEQMAAGIGLDPVAFKEAFSGETVRKIVQGDIDDSLQIGNSGTPSIFVDGRKLMSYQLQAVNLEFWEWLVNSRWKKQHELIEPSAHPPDEPIADE